MKGAKVNNEGFYVMLRNLHFISEQKKILNGQESLPSEHQVYVSDKILRLNCGEWTAVKLETGVYCNCPGGRRGHRGGRETEMILITRKL